MESFAHCRQDLWGGDILAVSVVPPVTLLVQVTDGDGNAEHIRTLRALDSTRTFQLAGWKIVDTLGESLKQLIDGNPSLPRYLEDHLSRW